MWTALPEREPEREQHAGHQLAAQADGDLAENDLRFRAGLVGLREQHIGRSPTGLDADLRLAVRDVGTNHRMRHVVHVMLGDQPVEDPLHGVPLLVGASRSARRMSPMTGLEVSSFEGRGGIGLRGAGHAIVSAARTVRRLT